MKPFGIKYFGVISCYERFAVSMILLSEYFSALSINMKGIKIK